MEELPLKESHRADNGKFVDDCTLEGLLGAGELQVH